MNRKARDGNTKNNTVRFKRLIQKNLSTSASNNAKNEAATLSQLDSHYETAGSALSIAIKSLQENIGALISERLYKCTQV